MELTNNIVQTVNANDNVIFITTRIPGNCSVLHTEGSGNIKMRGLSNNQCRSRFKVTFTGLTGSTSPKIKLGTSIISNCTLASSVATCTPNSTEVAKSETPYQLKYVDDCEADVVVKGVFVTVSSAFSLKASIVAFLALLIL